MSTSCSSHNRFRRLFRKESFTSCHVRSPMPVDTIWKPVCCPKGKGFLTACWWVALAEKFGISYCGRSVQPIGLGLIAALVVLPGDKGCTGGGSEEETGFERKIFVAHSGVKMGLSGKTIKLEDLDLSAHRKAFSSSRAASVQQLHKIPKAIENSSPIGVHISTVLHEQFLRRKLGVEVCASNRARRVRPTDPTGWEHEQG